MSRYRVQINHVKMTKSVLSPRERDSNRIGDSNNLLIVRTGRELNAGATAQI